MITRGHYIGQIIDELTAVSHQVESRAGLQLYDLNRYLEDFFKDVLNIVYEYKLVNLNEERSNNPGLDLGDEGAKVAFQITSTKSSVKINKTLEKAAAQISKFPTIYVLILVEKQGSYNALNNTFATPFKFKSNEHILDIGDVLKKVLSLPIERLQRLHDLVSKEVARVKIELEVPDKSGKYQTNIDAFIEKIPRERFEGAGSYYKHLLTEAKKQKSTYDVSEEDVVKDLNKFIKNIKKLPRISRQFYAFLLDRGEWHDFSKFINVDYLQRVCSFPDMEGELRLLAGAELCWYQEPDEYGESATLRISNVRRSKSYEFTWEFMDFLKQREISLEKVVVSLDFSDFK